MNQIGPVLASSHAGISAVNGSLARSAGGAH
jgi:hypothetical protein